MSSISQFWVLKTKISVKMTAFLCAGLSVFLGQISEAQWKTTTYVEATAPYLKAVARVSLHNKDNQFMGFCTGVLVDAQTVVTARHCGENMLIRFVVFGKDQNSIFAKVDRISTVDMPRTLSNMFDNQGQLSKDFKKRYINTIEKDLLVLHLETAVDIAPIEVISSNDIGMLNTETPIIVAGYPADSKLVDSMGLNVLVKRVEAPCNIEYLLNPNQNPPVYQVNCTTAGGNSGGPVIILTPTGQPLVIGILSTGGNGRNSNFFGITKEYLKNFN